MSKSPSLRRIQADIRELALDPSDRYYASPLENDMFEWHFTIRGADKTDFQGGVYHGRILLPAEYPFKPPHIVFLTPSGRFETNTKVCLSFSAYHPELWQPAWGIRLILEALISFLPTPADGAIGALDWSPLERQRLAKSSVNFVCPKCCPPGKTCVDLLPPLLKPKSKSTTATTNEEGGEDAPDPQKKSRFAKEIEKLQELQRQAEKVNPQNNNNNNNNANNNNKKAKEEEKDQESKPAAADEEEEEDPKREKVAVANKNANKETAATANSTTTTAADKVVVSDNTTTSSTTTPTAAAATPTPVEQALVTPSAAAPNPPTDQKTHEPKKENEKQPSRTSTSQQQQQQEEDDDNLLQPLNQAEEQVQAEMGRLAANAADNNDPSWLYDPLLNLMMVLLAVICYMLLQKCQDLLQELRALEEQSSSL